MSWFKAHGFHTLCGTVGLSCLAASIAIRRQSVKAWSINRSIAILSLPAEVRLRDRERVVGYMKVAGAATGPRLSTSGYALTRKRNAFGSKAS